VVLEWLSLRLFFSLSLSRSRLDENYDLTRELKCMLWGVPTCVCQFLGACMVLCFLMGTQCVCPDVGIKWELLNADVHVTFFLGLL
jgi:hypothetical protein